jgi:hypothetical protein
MNNHWEVNYKAFQEGEATFRYWMVPHGGYFDGAASERWGRAFCQPLLVVERRRSDPSGQLPFGIEGDRIVAASLAWLPGSEAYLLRLYNPVPSRESVTIKPLEETGLRVEYCDPSGDPTGTAGNRIELPGYGVTTLRIRTAGTVPEINLQLSDN